MENTEVYDQIKDIKHQFMTYRNGIVSEALRKAGMPYKIMFGLQVPQLAGIAASVKAKNTAAAADGIAGNLWDDRNVRESRLLACWLFDVSTMTEAKAMSLAADVMTREEADILCFRLLKRLPFAGGLTDRLKDEARPLVAYCGEALARNLE